MTAQVIITFSAAILLVFFLYRLEDYAFVNLICRLHTNLVCEFFRNARDMLQENGEIHVSHKTTYPFNKWKIEDLASNYALELIECADFKIEDYPGYTNKKGAGSNCDEPFPLGKCSTFKFMLCTAGATKLARVRKRKLDLVTVKYLEIPIQIEQQPAALFDRGLPYCPFTFTIACLCTMD